ncbi:hypothetical protein C8N47_102264 [Mangrovibacterium marinum]|uniref:Uncharacterized protein n=1 Tax=Mangrovibacterium marinum TaxID=1639118 RepID=A0A2T5C5U7_9BACT|nr:hypothetical protein C8N47_102264 [Mangrovibacterium marinum]
MKNAAEAVFIKSEQRRKRKWPFGGLAISTSLLLVLFSSCKTCECPAYSSKYTNPILKPICQKSTISPNRQNIKHPTKHITQSTYQNWLFTYQN